MTHELPSMAEQTQEDFSIRPVSIGKDGAADFGNGVIGPSKADIDSIEHEQKFSHEETAIVNELTSNGIVVAQRDSFLGKILTRGKENVTSALRTVNQRLGEKPVRIGAPLVLAFASLAEACATGRATAQPGREVELITVTPEPTVAMETMTPTPTVESTPTLTPEATEVAVKPLPDVISTETVQFQTLPPAEVQKLVEQATQNGEVKIPLPDILQEQGMSLVEVHHKDGQVAAFAITGDKPGEYMLPALGDGKVMQVIASDSATLGTLAVVREEQSWAYIFPSPSSSALKEGDAVTLGQSIVSFNYDPNSKAQETFINATLGVYPDMPKNTIAMIGLGDSKQQGMDIDRESILTTLTGSPITVSPTS